MFTVVYMAGKVVSTRIPAELYAQLAEASQFYMNEADLVRSAIRNELARAKALRQTPGGGDFEEWVGTQ